MMINFMNMNNVSKSILLIILILGSNLIYSCKKDKINTLAAIPGQIEIDKNGSIASFSLNTDADSWNIVNPAENWIALSSTSGTQQKALIQVSVTTKTTEQRSALLTINAGNADPVEVEVVQAASEFIYSISANISEFTFSRSGESKNLTITTDAPTWTITGDVDWLDFEPTSGETGTTINQITAIENDGEDGLKMLNSNNPDLIVSDIMMPVMDGIQLCENVKNNPEYSHIPIILLTAKSTHEDKVTGFKTGADEYITKPFDLDILKSRIEYLLNLRKKFIKQYQKSLRIESNQESITSLDEKLLNSILDLINTNVSNIDFSVNILSQQLGISRVHLYKKTMSLTGKTPIELIRMVRLKRASELLLTGEYNVSEISYVVGFGDPRYFSKMFKNEFGVLPSKYKENQGID
jgi:DNA-binding response OmpR family regulator